MTKTKVLTFLTTNLNVIHNYSDNLTKLFSNLYLVKFLYTLTKSFFPCKIPIVNVTV